MKTTPASWISTVPVKRPSRWTAAALVISGLAVPLWANAQTAEVDPDSPKDPIAILQEKINSGEAVLAFDEDHGYLPAVLEALGIPVSSQGLIFSRTSLQTNLITPWTPRAVYFNDDMYIGWVQDSPILEVAAVDPDEGGRFYTLPQERKEKPQFNEENSTCLMCHESKSVTEGIPGFMVRSVLVDRFGYPITPLHEGSTSDRTPFSERLGGYYVTGTHQGVGHAGNVMSPGLSHEVSDVARFLSEFDMTAEGSVTSLEGRFDIEPYLSPYSDLVALFVMTHQTRVHNLITVAHTVARAALGDQLLIQRVTGRAASEVEISPADQVRIEGAVERLVRSMMFSREAPFEGKVSGMSGFTEEFPLQGQRDGKGRSLREFDLERRLFKYPMSFLIYSDAFVTLPDLIKEAFYKRVDEILAGRDQSGEFEHLDEADRQAVREILTETKPEFLTYIAR